MKAAKTLQMAWVDYLTEQKRRMENEGFSTPEPLMDDDYPSLLEDVPEELRSIYDDITFLYAYDFHAAVTWQFLIEYQGKKVWLHVDSDADRVYYLKDDKGVLSQIPLGEHDYDDFFHDDVEKLPVYQFFGLQLDFDEWEVFGSIFFDFDFRRLADKLKTQHQTDKFTKLKSSFDPSKIELVKEGGSIYLKLPTNEKIYYKHVSEV